MVIWLIVGVLLAVVFAWLRGPARRVPNSRQLTPEEVEEAQRIADQMMERHLAQRRRDRALAGTDERPGRSPIPRAVQREVWRRDQGRCIRCGSQERLEFDHIIPVIQGGSNTVRNVQLLCERCNREKGATV